MNQGNRFYVVDYIAADGSVGRRNLFLDSIPSARAEMIRQGVTVLSVRERSHGAWQKEWYSRDYKTWFLKGILFHVEVGASPGRALMLVIDTEANPRKRLEMQSALDVINSGGSFADALSSLPFLDRSVVAILRAGEATGVKEAVEDSIALIERRTSAWGVFAGSMGFVVFDLFSTFASLISTQYWGLPWMEKNLMNQSQVNDPGKLELMQAKLASLYFWNGLLLWSSVGATLVVAASLYLFFFGPTSIRDKIANWIAGFPLMRKVLIDAGVGDGLMLLARMARNGVSLIDAMFVLENSTSLQPIKRFWRGTAERIRNSQSVAKAMTGTGLLLKHELLSLESHQDRSQLAHVLDEMSSTRRQMAAAGVKQVTRVLLISSLVFMALSFAISIAALGLQDTGVGAGMDQMMSGGF